METPAANFVADKPLLSICVPTYKRAALLRSLLRGLAPQVAAQNGRVELIVSDNCSPDNTPDAVAWAQQFGPIRYHRNEENIGGARNFIQLAQTMAQGEYCWLMGDDDLVQPDAVARIVEALTAHPDIDYAFLNYTIVEDTRADARLIAPEEFDTHPTLRTMCFDTGETRVVDRWEDIMLLTRTEALFTYMGCHVLRTSLWRAQEIPINKSDFELLSMISTFPFAYVTGLHMIGRPVLYLGKPLVVLFVGPQEWYDWYPFIKIVSMTELAEFFRSRGARPAALKQFLSILFADSSYHFWTLLRKKDTPGRAKFRWARYFRYAGYPAFWRMIGLYPLNEFVKPLFRPLTRLVKAATGRGDRDTAGANGAAL